MVEPNIIYTKACNDGTISLFNRKQITKSASRIEVLGTVDELNAALGAARKTTL